MTTPPLLRPLRARAVGVATLAMRTRWALSHGERTLEELGLWYGADKSSAAHGFAEIYETYVRSLRRSEVTLIEIGVWRGASLQMWRDYFVRGRIFGVDISPEAAAQAGGRIEVFIGDQVDGRLWASVLERSGAPDIVIDDGGHRAHQQLGTLGLLWPHLRPGGLYVIEDTHTSYLSGYGMGWRKPGTTIQALKELVDDLHLGWHDERVTLADLDFVHFYRGTCVLGKTPVYKRNEFARRLRAAAARRSGAWTG